MNRRVRAASGGAFCGELTRVFGWARVDRTSAAADSTRARTAIADGAFAARGIRIGGCDPPTSVPAEAHTGATDTAAPLGIAPGAAVVRELSRARRGSVLGGGTAAPRRDESCRCAVASARSRVRTRRRRRGRRNRAAAPARRARRAAAAARSTSSSASTLGSKAAPSSAAEFPINVFVASAPALRRHGARIARRSEEPAATLLLPPRRTARAPRSPPARAADPPSRERIGAPDLASRGSPSGSSRMRREDELAPFGRPHRPAVGRAVGALDARRILN